MTGVQTCALPILWKQFSIHVDLYKHYLDLIIKFNAFHYAVTGAIISFYFSKNDISLIRYSLLFPVLMSFGFAVFFFYATSKIKNLRAELLDIVEALGLHMIPEVNVLKFLLILSGVLFLIVATSLLGLFMFG